MKRKIIISLTMLLALMMFENSSTLAAEGSNSNANAQQGQSTYQSQNVYTTGGGGGDGSRSFAIGNQANFPALANNFGTVTFDGRFEPLADILVFQNAWTMGQARALAEQKGGKVDCAIARNYPGDRPPTQSLMFLVKPQNPEELAKFNQNFALIKPASFFGKNRATTMKVFGRAVLEGLECGADVALYSEGFNLVLDARSIGIGIQNSLSVVGGGGPTGVGGVSGGGIGWTKATAEYCSKPYLKVKYFRRISNGGYAPSPAVVPPEQEKDSDGTLFRPEAASMEKQIMPEQNGESKKRKIKQTTVSR